MHLDQLTPPSRLLLRAILAKFERLSDLHFFLLGESGFRDEATYIIGALTWFRTVILKQKVLLGIAENGVSNEEIKRLNSNFEDMENFADSDANLKDGVIPPVAIRIFSLFAKLDARYESVKDDPEYREKLKAARKSVEQRAIASYDDKTPLEECFAMIIGLYPTEKLKRIFNDASILEPPTVKPKNTEELLALCITLLRVARTESILSLGSFLSRIQYPYLSEMVSFVTDGVGPDFLEPLCHQQRTLATEMYAHGKLSRQKYEEVVIVSFFTIGVLKGLPSFLFEAQVKETLDPMFLKETA